MLRAFGVTDKGPVRPVNEDCFAVHPELGLFVVADGMGGHNAGEVAARMVVHGVVDHVRRAVQDSASFVLRHQPALHPFGVDPALSDRANLLRNAILLANVEILESAVRTRDYAGMGTTVVAAQIVDGRLSVGYAGDSRLYLAKGGKLRRLTTDDSWIAAMLAHEPDDDPQRYQNHPMRHALTNVVGGRTPTDVHVVEEMLTGGEWLLLTTDGVHGVLADRVLEQLLADGERPEAVARGVVAAALAHGSKDNCTAVVAHYD